MEELTKAKNNAYWERNQLVAALSKLLPSHLAKHSIQDNEWEDDWRNIVVIHLPLELTPYADVVNGPVPDDIQMTWHIHDHDMPMFDHLRYVDYPDYVWDGHDTAEKYKRLRLIQQAKSSDTWGDKE